jgi:hypothetical protein
VWEGTSITIAAMLNKTSDDDIIPIVAAVPLPDDYHHDDSFPFASASEITTATARIVLVENGYFAEDEEEDRAPPADVRGMAQSRLPAPASECLWHGTKDGSAECNHLSPCCSDGDVHYDAACFACAAATAPRPMNRAERREWKPVLERGFRSSMKKEAKQCWKDVKRAAKEEWKAEKSAWKSCARDLKQCLREHFECAAKEETLHWKAEIQREKQLLEDNTRAVKEGAIRLFIREGKQELSEFKESIRSIV